MKSNNCKLTVITLLGFLAGLSARPAAAADSTAAIQTTHRMSAVGVGLTMASVPVIATGELMVFRALVYEDWSSDDFDSKLTTGYGLYATGAGMGLVGAPLMSASQLVTAKRLRRSGTDVTMWAGWAGVGSTGLAVLGQGTGWGWGNGSIGYLSAATFGTIQHVQNGRAGRESGALTAAPARKVNLALAPAHKGVRLVGTF
jgi:hypothetical protein